MKSIIPKDLSPTLASLKKIQENMLKLHLDIQKIGGELGRLKETIDSSNTMEALRKKIKKS